MPAKSRLGVFPLLACIFSVLRKQGLCPDRAGLRLGTPTQEFHSCSSHIWAFDDSNSCEWWEAGKDPTLLSCLDPSVLAPFVPRPSFA